MQLRFSAPLCFFLCVFSLIASQIAFAQSSDFFEGKADVAIHSIFRCEDGQTCIAAFDNGDIEQWNFFTKERLRTFEGHKGAVLSLKRLNADNFLSSGSDGTIRLWSMERDVLPIVIEAPDRSFLQDIEVVYGSELVRHAQRDRWIARSIRSIIECVDGKSCKVLLKTNSISRYAVSPDGKHLAVSLAPSEVFIFDLTTMSKTRKFEFPRGDNELEIPRLVSSIEYSPDGKTLLVLSKNRHKTVCFTIEMETGSTKLLEKTEIGARTKASYFPSGRFIALNGFELLIIDSQNGNLVAKLPSPPTQAIPKSNFFRSMALSETDSVLEILAGTSDGRVFRFEHDLVVEERSRNDEGER